MPTMDVFNADGFTLSSLTTAVNELPYQPTRIGESGLFSEQGVTTTTIQIEHKKGVLELVPNTPRNAPSTVPAKSTRELRSFICQHLPQTDTIMADEVQNLRAFGQENEEQAVLEKVNQRQAELRLNIDVTMEHLRCGAVQGKILDADGSTVIYDLFAEFGVTQQSVDFVLGTDTTEIRNKCIESKRKSEDVLGATPVSGYWALCSDGFFDAFTAHSAVEAAFDRWNQGEFLRSDSRSGFEFAGIQWENYRGSVNGVDFIPAGEAFLVPLGVVNLFRTWFAPGNYMETVNTIGLPLYSALERMSMDKGVQLEVQSNPLSLCTRPASVIRLFSSN